MFILILYGLCLNYASALVTPVGECPSNLRPAMVRLVGYVPVKPQFVAKVDLSTCSMHCRRNIHPLTEAPFDCRGFNFLTGRNPTCEFFTMDQLLSSEEIEPKEGSYFFEKTCLRIPPRCEEAAFALDGRRGVRLKTSRETRLAYSEEECIYACFMEDCRAFEWNSLRRTCAVYHETRRDVDIERVQPVIYYENNCIDPSLRCPQGRVEFLLARGSDVQSFGVSVGIRSIRNCMRECVETMLFHCRSFQFSPSSSECFVSDESSEVAVPSQNLDLYEPFCVPHEVDSRNCNRPYSFEKVLTSTMTGATELQRFEKLGVEPCLNNCLAARRCRSVNYDVSTRTCILLDKTRADASIAPDENYDFYELACEPVSVTLTTAHEELYQVLSQGKALKPDFNRAPHLNIKTIDHCWQLCRQADFVCNVFSYSSSLFECQLGSLDMLSEDDEPFTVYHPEFSLYAVVGSASKQDELRSLETNFESFSSNVVTSTFHPTLLPENIPTSSTTSTTTTSPALPAHSENSLDNDIFFFANSDLIAEEPDDKFPFATSSIDLTTVIGESTVPPATSVSNKTSTTERKADSLELMKPALGFASIPEKVKDVQPELVEFNSYEEWDSNKEPELLPIERGVGYARPETIKVQAQCHNHGMNITFHVNDTKPYTGAIYAAERFEQCRVFIKQKSDFALFVPRPQHNTWCNAIEINGTMSVMIVMSNDHIVPHDVTTVNDLFYQVSCSFNNSSARVIHGLVVGGPSPIALPQNTALAGRRISLKITKKGKPVDSVYIGETLVAHVESDIPAENLRIVDCSANRVGGSGAPSSIHLIADGCALLPTLMSAMFMGSSGWQATLSAFRIDGSEHIDIICMVAICEKDAKCAPETLSCPPSNDRIVRSLDDAGEIRVDSRLRVRGEQSLTSRLPQVCVQPVLYISILLLLTVSMLAMCISIGTGFLRHRRKASGRSILHHTLADDSRYVRTMAL